MKTLCKRKKKSERSKKKNLELFESTATFQCKKCGRLSDCKKALCKPRKRSTHSEP